MQIQQGLFWHVHHDKLIEYCYRYDERAEFILKNKDKSEQELRLRLFQPVKGTLPQEVVQAWQASDQAWQAYDQARQALDQARQALDQAWQALDQAWQASDQAWQASDQAWQASDQARLASDQAWQALDQARQASDQALARNKTDIEALHKVECPNCPWNGQTIFI